MLPQKSAFGIFGTFLIQGVDRKIISKSNDSHEFCASISMLTVCHYHITHAISELI